MSIYYTYDGRYHKFYSYSQLINWIAQHDIPYLGTEWANGFLRYCGNNSNDTVTFRDWHTGANEHCQRSNRIYNEDWHSIFNSTIITDVRKATYNATIEEDRKRQERKDNEWHIMLERAGYPRRRIWRPYRETHPTSHSWGHYSRGVAHRDRCYAADPEHAPYIRPARSLNYLPTYWDDKWNRCSSGWKSSTKCRHQWEPRARREAKRTNSLLPFYLTKNICYNKDRK